MKKKEIITNLTDEVLNQYCQNIRIVMKTKKLFLRPNLSLRDLSNEAGIPIDDIAKVLSTKLQLTFFEFISEYKINEAKQLLATIREDQFSISSIADQSGFNTIDSFTIIFKQYTNISPEEYRIKYFKIESDASASYTD